MIEESNVYKVFYSFKRNNKSEWEDTFQYVQVKTKDEAIFSTERMISNQGHHSWFVGAGQLIPKN